MAETKQEPFSLAAVLAGVSTLNTGSAGDREQIEYIDIDRIHPDERNFYALDGIDALAANIELVGLQQPIRVRPGETDGDYVIVSGHRRHAGIRKLVEDGNESFRAVPCIVERSAAGGETASLLQELRLIYANSDTRTMSSAEKAKEAERVEMLLYRLKEAGMEFPGRMRDHVAEACKMSASKLGRLKVIRERLDGEMKEQWEAGKLNESEAYNLAKLPPEHRAVIWAHKGANAWNYAGATAVAEFGERLEKVDDSAAPDAIPDSCPVGYCANLEQRREASLRDSIYRDSRCERCCHGCPDIGTCKYACPSLSEEIAQAKKAKKDERKAQKEQTKEAARPTIELLTRLWRRFGEARKVGRVSLDEFYKVNDFYPRPVESDYLPKEQGTAKLKSDDRSPFGYRVDASGGRLLCSIADKMGVSLDYLLCRTDDPREVREIKKEVREWRSRGETPPEGKPIITYALTNDGPKYTPAVWDGRRFHAPGKPGKELTGLAQQFTKWTLLPEDE